MGNSNYMAQQKQLITPELCQAITVLQLATADLVRYIENAVLENPMLEIAEDADAVVEIPSDPDREDFTLEWCTILAECGQIDCSLDRSWAQPEDSLPYNTEHCLAQMPTLHEYLSLQLSLDRPESPIREISGFLINSIDGRGYFQGDLRDVQKACACTDQEATQALSLLQSFDPPGVGSRNLKECLLLQLERRGLRNMLIEKMVSHFLEGPTSGQYSRIARVLGITMEEATAKYDLIRSLDHCPGHSFSSPGEPRYIIPDVVVERAGDDFLVLVNDFSVPQLMVNRTYQALLTKRGTCDLHEAQFLEEKLQAAVWLIRSIEQRRAILYRVVQLIIQFQGEFLNHGPDYLRPLDLKKIARLVGLHESTVSRTIANKYVQTPRGVFDLKTFFGRTTGAGEFANKRRKH